MPRPPFLRFLIDRFWAHQIAIFGPESLDGPAALASINVCLEQDGYAAPPSSPDV